MKEDQTRVPPFRRPGYLHKVPSDQLGFSTLSDPKDAEFDIIATHGLGAIPNITWKDKASGVNWLSDAHMLPARFPKARILSYGYDSIYVSKNPVRTNVRSIAEGFLQSVWSIRKDNHERPIIFLAHCFGGLVITQAFILDRLQSKAILQPTAGIVFLGTPHRGTRTFSDHSSLLRIISAAAAASRGDYRIFVEPDVLSATRSNYSKLVEGSENFATLCTSLRLDVCCVYELRSSDVGIMVGEKGMSEFIVDEGSAKLDGHPALGLPLDHFSLNKFDSPNDGNYKAICNQLERMYEKAVEHKDQGKR